MPPAEATLSNERSVSLSGQSSARRGRAALRAAGIEHRRIYGCRHTFASWAIAGGMQLFHLSRVMGTSVAMIDATYGHLLPHSEDYLRGLLDSYDDVCGLSADAGGGE
jgi:integrase